jgi:glucose/mannose-6-phosphate isomerase
MEPDFIKYDTDRLLAITDSLPEDAEKSLNNSLIFSENCEDISNIVIFGMGGSCISADLLKSYLYDKSEIPIIVNRNNLIPNFINSKSLCIFISYSGNTYETLSCYKQSVSKNAKCIIISSGGELEKVALENNHKIVKITGTVKMPRAAVGDLFYSLIGVLSSIKSLNINIDEIKSSFDTLKEIREKQNFKNNSTMLELAQKAKHKNIIVFGTSPLTESIALRWKNQLNENSKVTVIYNSYPELTHNEIVNLAQTDLKNYFIIVLRDKSESDFIKKQIDTSLTMFKDATIENIFVDKNSFFERQISLVYLGDYFSIYHALINGINPTPIEAIMTLKEKMKE